MDATEAIYLQGRATILADNGPGGLLNALTAFRLVGGISRNSDPSRTQDRPYLRIEVIVTEKAREQVGRQGDALVRIKIVADRDRQREDIESVGGQVAGRLVDILNGVAWSGAAGTGWNLSIASFLRTIPFHDGKESGLLSEYRVHGDK